MSPGAQRLLQPRADLAQHLVAGVMAERVVELLEAVEVDQQQRDLARRRRWIASLQPRQQMAAVAEPGQVVGDRLRGALCAQAVDDRQPGPRHPGQHGDRRQRRGDRRQADELADDEQRQRGRRVGQDRGEHDRVELGRGVAAGSRSHDGGRERDGREHGQLAERDQPDQRAGRAPRSRASGRARAPRRRRSRASVAGSSAPVVTASAPTAQPPITKSSQRQRQRPPEPRRRTIASAPAKPSAQATTCSAEPAPNASAAAQASAAANSAAASR